MAGVRSVSGRKELEESAVPEGPTHLAVRHLLPLEVPERQAVIVVFSNRRDADVQTVAVDLLKTLPS